jgi:ribosome-binding protein aMBF1 (putative translation factor)
MPSDFFTELLDFGALGLFAGFLIYLYISMQKRLDALVDKFQQQLDKINKDYDSRIDKMRERYDIVIREAREEASMEKELSQKLDAALAKLDEGLVSMREQYKEMEVARKLREAKKR